MRWPISRGDGHPKEEPLCDKERWNPTYGNIPGFCGNWKPILSCLKDLIALGQNAETLGLFSVHSQADLRSVSRASWKNTTLHKHGSAVCRQWLWGMWFSWRHDERYFPKTTWKSFIKWSASIQKDLDHFQEVFGLEEFLFRAIPQLALLHHGDDIPERGGCRPRKPKLLQQLLVHSRMRRWQDQRVTPWDRTIVLCMWPSLSTTWLGTFSRSKTLNLEAELWLNCHILGWDWRESETCFRPEKLHQRVVIFAAFIADDSFSTTCGHGSLCGSGLLVNGTVLFDHKE